VIVVGLTGSIGMGKSTALAFFAELGVPVWDADAAVHRLYGPGAAGTAAIARILPDTVGPSGVDRATLRRAALAQPALMKRIEAAVHPLVAADRDRFLAEARASGARVAVCDIPLLFETGADRWLDRVVVVSAPADLQRRRVMERQGMTEAAFEGILSRQVPDAEKRARADHIIDTSGSKEETRAQIVALMDELAPAGTGA